MTEQGKREELRKLGRLLIAECEFENADPTEIVIRYSSKLAKMRIEWEADEKLRANRARKAREEERA